MATKSSSVDPEFTPGGRVDPEFTSAGRLDPEFPATTAAAGGLTAAQELPAFVEALSGQMVGIVWK